MKKLLQLLILATLGFATTAWGATYTWTGSANDGNLWETSTNWDLNNWYYPQSGSDTAVIPDSDVARTIVWGSGYLTAAIPSVTIGANSTLQVNAGANAHNVVHYTLSGAEAKLEFTTDGTANINTTQFTIGGGASVSLTSTGALGFGNNFMVEFGTFTKDSYGTFTVNPTGGLWGNSHTMTFMGTFDATGVASGDEIVLATFKTPSDTLNVNINNLTITSLGDGLEGHYNLVNGDSIKQLVVSVVKATEPEMLFQVNFEDLSDGDISYKGDTGLSALKGLLATTSGTTDPNPTYKVETLATTKGSVKKAIRKSSGSNIVYASLVGGEGTAIPMVNSAISFWGKAPNNDWKDLTGIDYVLRSDSSTRVYQDLQRANNTSVQMYGTEALKQTTSMPIVEGVLNHFVIVSSGITQTYYINGKLEATTTIPSSLSMADYNYHSLGFGASISTFSDRAVDSGGIADVRVYNKALTPEEVVALYNEDVSVYDLTAGGVTKLSEIAGLVTGAASVATIQLPADATFEIDGTYELNAISFESTGVVTLKIADSALANIARVNADGVSGTVTLEWTADGGETALGAVLTKTYGVDVVKKVDANDYTSTSYGFANQQLIVQGGNVILDTNLTSTIATAEKPMTVSGADAELKFKGHQAANRAPGGATILAKDGATLALEAVNPFPGDRPYIKIDNATFRLDNYSENSGSHMKVNTVTLSNNSQIQIAGPAAYGSQGLYIQQTGANHTPAQLTVDSGTENTVGYASGAAELYMVIESGIIEVAQNAKLTVDVKLQTDESRDLTKKGAGELEMPQSRAKNTDIQAGTLLLTGVTGTLTQTMTGEGTLKLTATGDVTLNSAPAQLAIASAYNVNLGASRPTITELTDGATLTITPTADELIAGKITLQTSGVTLTTENLTVTDDENFTIGDDGTILLSTAIPTWTPNDNGGAWSKEPVAGETVLIDFGTTTGQTCIWNHDTATTYATLVVKGSGTIDFTGSAVTLNGLELSADSKTVHMSAIGTLHLTGALSGNGVISWTSGKIIQTNNSILHSEFNGNIIVEGGTWQWGRQAENNDGYKADATVNANSTLSSLGSSITVKSNAQLKIHPWTSGGHQNKNVNDKVNFTTPIVLEGGTIWCEDGSYAFASIQVNTASTLHQKWGSKAAVIQRLFGAGVLTFNHDRNSDTNPGYLAVWYTYNQQDGISETDSTAFTGKLLMRSAKTGPLAKLHSDTTSGFNKALIDLGERTVYLLNAERSAGALVGAGSVESNTAGTERTLKVGGYAGELADADVFSGTISGDIKLAFGADNVALKLTGTLGTVADGASTYTKDIAITSGSTLSLGMTTPATLSGVLSGMGALEVTGGTQTLSGANTYSGGTTVTAGTLKIQGTADDHVVLPHTEDESRSVTVESGATLELNRGLSFTKIEGVGLTKVTGTFTFGLGGNGSNILTPLEIAKDEENGINGVLKLRPWREYALSVPTLTVNGTLQRDDVNAGDHAPTVTIVSGNTLKGSGTISLATTFADGSTLDASAGAPTISGDVTWPTSEGKVTVKIAANTNLPAPILVKAGATPPTNYQVQVGDKVYTDGSFEIVQTAEGLTLTRYVAKGDNGTYYESIIDAVNQVLSGDMTGTVELYRNVSDNMTIDETKSLTLVGKDGLYSGTLTIGENATVTLKGDSVFINALGGLSGIGTLIIDASDASVVINDSVKGYLQAFTGKVIFKGAGDNGVTVNYGVANAEKALKAKFAFDAGTHNFTYGCGNHLYAEGSGDSNPTIAVMNGANVAFTMKDLSGWGGTMQANPAVVAVQSGTMTLKQNTNNNTGYFRERLLLSDNTTLTIQANNSDFFHVYGGLPADYEHAQIALDSGEATITGSTIDIVSGGGGAGFGVKEGAVLTVSAPISGNETAGWKKVGAGTLRLAANVTGSGTLIVTGGAIGGAENTAVTVAGTVKFEDGTTLDATAGILSVNAVSAQGLLKVKVLATAQAGDVILTKGGETALTVPTKYQVLVGDATTGSTTLALDVDSNGNLALVETTVPVTVDGQAYPTLAAAIAAAGANGTVMITENYSVDALDLSSGVKLAFAENAVLNVKNLTVGTNRDFMVKDATTTPVTYWEKEKLVVVAGGSVSITESDNESTPILVPWTWVDENDVTITIDALEEDNNQSTGGNGVTIDEDGNIAYKTTLHGKGAWYEYLFEKTVISTDESTGETTETLVGTLEGTGRVTGLLGDDATDTDPVRYDDVVAGRKAMRIVPAYAYTAPTYPTEWAATFFGLVPNVPGGILISFGTKDGGTITLAHGEGNQVLLVRTNAGATTFTELASMDVPNATTAYHLYTFVRTNEGITIYLDGNEWTPYTWKNDAEKEIGNGLQIGSIHGGYASGSAENNWVVGTTSEGKELKIGRAASLVPQLKSEGKLADMFVANAAAIDMLRLYDCDLDDYEVGRTADIYKYSSPNGTYTRTLEGANENWVSSTTTTNEDGEEVVVGAWTKGSDTFDNPNLGQVNLTTKLDTTVAINLVAESDVDNSLEGLNLSGVSAEETGKITFVDGSTKAEDGTVTVQTKKLSVSGMTAVNVDVEVDCSVMTLGGPVRVADGRTLTLKIPESLVESWKETYRQNGLAQSHRLTGAVTLGGEDAKVEFSYTALKDGWVMTTALENSCWYAKLDHNPWFVEVNGDTVTWKSGVDAETAVEVTSPEPVGLYGLPVVVTATADGKLALPSDVFAMTVSGPGKVTLTGTSAIAALTLEENASVVLSDTTTVSSKPTLATNATLTLGTGGTLTTLPLNLNTCLPESGTLALHYNDTVALEAALDNSEAAGDVDCNVTIKSGTTLELQALGGYYNGIFTVEEGAVLKSTKNSATIPFGKWDTKIVNRGQVRVAGACANDNGEVTGNKLPAIEGEGVLYIDESAIMCAPVSGRIVVAKGKTLKLATGGNDFSTTPSITNASLEINGVVDAGTYTITMAEGKILSGAGTVTGNVTFADGAIIDATAGSAVTVTGDVSFPTNESKPLIVKVSADATTTVLEKVGLTALPTYYRIYVGDEDKTADYVLKAADGLTVYPAVVKIATTPYATLQEALNETGDLTLFADIDPAEAVTISGQKVIALNGKTLAGTVTLTAVNAKLTVNGTKPEGLKVESGVPGYTGMTPQPTDDGATEYKLRRKGFMLIVK